MLISDYIRKHTFSLRDSLSNMDKKISNAKAERDASEERRKRATTEYSAHGTLEREIRQLLKQSAEKVIEIQSELDELNKKRQEIIDTLFKIQEEQAVKDGELKDAQNAKSRALSRINEEEKERKKAENQIFSFQEEMDNIERSLTQKLNDAFSIYLADQAEQIQEAFLTKEHRAKERQEFEEFNKARHSDPEIAGLWDQRLELKKFISTAMVPGVKQALQDTLKTVDEKIACRYPSAIKAAEKTPQDRQIEELLYFTNNEGKIVLSIPISKVDWENIESGEANDRLSRIVCFLWSLINELKLKNSEVKVEFLMDFVVFETCFNIEDIAMIQEFRVKRENSEVMQFILTPVPVDLQEALSNES